MQHLIHVLPDVLANQIAAGEVVQRPASVIKELLENAVDAGASRIDVVIKDAGKTLIQVTDNGSGMSIQDARMAFERHATSKIQNQDDLFNIRTLGFRGEALASIAAVAQVKLKTRLRGEDLGVEIDIEGNQIKRQEACVCPEGSTFLVKNLFFNVPARRNFLKSNPVEARHILQEFIRVAVPNHHVHLTLQHNGTEVYDLHAGDRQQRLVDMFGKDLEGNLRGVEEETGYAAISGYLASPKVYRRQRGEQFFFVNGRYIRHHYLQHAVASAYEEFLPKDSYPFYCLFIDIDPVHVDINIHPTKTEVKFDDERTLYVLLQGIVKRSLGEAEDAPVIDWEDDDLKEAIYGSKPVTQNPPPQSSPSTGSASGSGGNRIQKLPIRNQPRKEDWEPLFQPPRKSESAAAIPNLFGEADVTAGDAERETLMVQWQNRFILTDRGQKLFLIDQHLAHQRILFERFLYTSKGKKLDSQQLLFPQTMEFPAQDFVVIREVEHVLSQMGFEVKEFGTNALIVYGTPSGVATGKVRDIFDRMLEDLQHSGGTRAKDRLFETIARSLAVRAAVTSPHKLSIIEMKNMVEDLFACDSPAFSPGGKPTWKAFQVEELVNFFQGL